MSYTHAHQKLEELGVFKFKHIKPFDIDTDNPFMVMYEISKCLKCVPHVFHRTHKGLHLFILSSNTPVCINNCRRYATRETLVELFGADIEYEKISSCDFYGLRTKVKASSENCFDFFIKSVHYYNMSHFSLNLDRVKEYQDYYQTCLSNFALLNGGSNLDDPF